MDAYDRQQGSYTPMGPSTADRIPRQQRLNALANPPVDRAWRDTSSRPSYSSGVTEPYRPSNKLSEDLVAKGNAFIEAGSPKMGFGAFTNGSNLAVPKRVGDATTATTSTANATSRPMARSASSVTNQPAQPDQNNAPASEEPTVAQKNSTAAPFVQRRPQYQDTTQQSLRTTPGTPFNAQAPSSVFQNSMSDYEPERYEGNYGLFSIDPNMWFNDFLSDYGSFDSDMNLGLGIRY